MRSLLVLSLTLIFGVIFGNFGLGHCNILANISARNAIIHEKNPPFNEGNFERLNDFQKAIIATADAYWRRGTNLQYEPRLKYYRSPEEATEDNIQYGTCNTFTFDVYKEALGISTPLSSISAVAFFNNQSEYVVLALDGKKYAKCVEEGLEKTILQKMEPGDLILYRNNHNKDGHAQIVYSLIYDSAGNVVDAWIIHGTTAGIKNHAMEKRISRYDMKRVEGSVQKVKFSASYKKYQELDETKARYMNYFVLVRPIFNGKTWLTWDNYTIADEKNAKNKNADGRMLFGKDKNGNEIRRGMKKAGTEREEKVQITKAAKDRIKFEGIFISKTTNYHNKTVVPVNSEVVYTVTVKNFSKKNYEDLLIREKIPQNATYITGGDKVENKTVIWNNVTIPAGKEKKFSYTIRTPILVGIKLVSEGTVNSIKTTTVKNITGRVFTNEEIEKIRNSFYKLKDSSTNVGFVFIDEVYTDAFGFDLGISELKTTEILTNTNRMIALKNMETLMHNDNQYDYKRYLKFYYNFKETCELYNTERIREINLHPGEIILSSKDDINNAYIYLGNEIVGKNSNGITIYNSAEEKDKFLKDLYFADEVRDKNDFYIERNKFKVKNIVISPANVVKGKL